MQSSGQRGCYLPSLALGECCCDVALTHGATVLGCDGGVKPQIRQDYSQHSGRAETEKPFSQRIVRRAADHDVVDELDIHRSGSFTKLPGDQDIRCARSWVAAGVIMNANDCAGGLPNGGAKDFTGVGEGCGGSAGTDLHPFDEAVLAIKAEHPEFFHVETNDERSEVSGDEVGAIQQGRLAGLLTDDAEGDLHHRDQLERLDVTDSFEFAVILFLPVRQARERAGFGKQA